MAVYFVVNSSVQDIEQLNEYMATVGPSLEVVPLKILSIDAECETIEGTPPGSRTVLVEFASKEDFQTWYNSPEYQAVVGKRLAATTGFGLLAQGL